MKMKRGMARDVRLSQLAALFDAFERDEVELSVDMLIARLDAIDGDADLEPNGDELDGSLQAEDEIVARPPLMLRWSA